MKRETLFLVLLLLPFIVHCKGQDELIISIRGGILFNGRELTSELGNSPYTNMKNTFMPGAGIRYTRVTNFGLLLSAGIDAGYEKYNAVIDFPFDKLGYYKPAVLGPQYVQKLTVPFIEPNVSIGYRLKAVKLAPEIRIGQMLHMPFAYKGFGYWSEENAVNGYSNYNFIIDGQYGKSASNGIIGELINYVYIGCALPVKIRPFKKVTVGIQAQKQIFMSSINSFHVEYNDAYGFVQSKEDFNGKHESVSLVLGFAL